MKVQVRFGIVILGGREVILDLGGEKRVVQVQKRSRSGVGGWKLDLREEKGVVQVQKRRKSRGWRSGIGPGRGEESGPGPKKKEVGSWRSEIGPEKQEGGALGPKNQEEKLFWIWEGRREPLRPKKEAG